MSDELSGLLGPALVDAIGRLVDERVEQALAELERDRRRGGFVTVAEAAEATGLTVRAIRSQVAAGRIPARRLGTRILVDLDALEA